MGVGMSLTTLMKISYVLIFIQFIGAFLQSTIIILGCLAAVILLMLIDKRIADRKFFRDMKKLDMKYKKYLDKERKRKNVKRRR